MPRGFRVCAGGGRPTEAGWRALPVTGRPEKGSTLARFTDERIYDIAVRRPEDIASTSTSMKLYNNEISRYTFLNRLEHFETLTGVRVGL